MFEATLYNNIKNNFTIAGYDLSFGFGEIADNIKSPYIVMFVLNTNGDRQVLCHEDDYTDGDSFIQWNIYDKSAKNAFYIKQELIKYIGGLSKITLGTVTYQIGLNDPESSPSGQSITTGLHTEIVARSFTYEKK